MLLFACAPHVTVTTISMHWLVMVMTCWRDSMSSHLLKSYQPDHNYYLRSCDHYYDNNYDRFHSITSYMSQRADLSTLPTCHGDTVPLDRNASNSQQIYKLCLPMQCDEQLSKVQKRSAALDYVQECQEYETKALGIKEGAPKTVCFNVNLLLLLSSCGCCSACLSSYTCYAVTRADLFLSVCN